MLQFYHNLPLLIRVSSYHAARINVSRNAILNSRSEEKKTFSLTFIPGKNKSKCGFVVCTLIDNGYASLLFSRIMFPYCFCMLSMDSKTTGLETRDHVGCLRLAHWLIPWFKMAATEWKFVT